MTWPRRSSRARARDPDPTISPSRARGHALEEQERPGDAVRPADRAA